jgi:glycosyltransferase involved in cell wall biosynthesis
MNQPLISVITPSYNQAQFLEKTIQSVLSQDYPAIEFIIIDGGSNDGSQDIIQKYDQKLAFWLSEKDRGQAEAVNKGLAKATGKYIGWLNSDDLYLPGTISKAVKLLEVNPNAGLVFGDVQAINETGQITNIMHYGNWTVKDLIQFRIIGQPGVFMRKEIVVNCGGLDDSYHFLLDHHLWLRMGLEGSMVYSSQIWSAARFHASAKNISQAASFGEEAYRLVEWIEGEAGFNDLWSKYSKRIWAGAHRMNARYLLDGGQPKKALQAYWTGLKSDFFIVAPEWHRMVYALLSILGFRNLRELYLKLRLWVKKPDQKGYK